MEQTQNLLIYQGLKISVEDKKNYCFIRNSSQNQEINAKSDIYQGSKTYLSQLVKSNDGVKSIKYLCLKDESRPLIILVK